VTTNLPTGPVATPVLVASGRLKRWRLPLIALAIVAVFIATYALAWWDAIRLTTAYTADADASFEAGSYLEALAGHEEFDEESNEFVYYGGYGDVMRIWRDRYARPIPSSVSSAEARIDEIINERLTIEQAEQFVLENIGRTNPYLGIVYLRLGELYEEEGDTRSAEDIYREVQDLFVNQPELIERATANLARMGADE
jgi:tetratricopeptide (TPR) repeat protein